MIILSVAGVPGSQELQPMMFNFKKVDIFCVPERGKNQGVSQA